MKRKGKTILFFSCTVAILFLLIAFAQAGEKGQYKERGFWGIFWGKCPIWNIFNDGTNQSVKWRKHKPNPRFRIYDAETPSDESDDLVLDRETGLVWERYPDATDYDWFEAIDVAFNKYLGGRKGWRIPTAEELASLVDINAGPPTLPAGHPFINIELRAYWTSTTYAEDPSRAWDVFFLDGNLNNGKIKGVNTGLIWCVRGGQGHDAY